MRSSPTAETAAQALNNAADLLQSGGSSVSDAVKRAPHPGRGSEVRRQDEVLLRPGRLPRLRLRADRRLRSGGVLLREAVVVVPRGVREEARTADKVEEMRGTAGDAIYSAAVFRKGLDAVGERRSTNYNEFVAGLRERRARARHPHPRSARSTRSTSAGRRRPTSTRSTSPGPRTTRPLEAIYFARLHYGQADASKHGQASTNGTQIYDETIADVLERYVDGWRCRQGSPHRVRRRDDVHQGRARRWTGLPRS